jgi:hypothetical protein
MESESNPFGTGQMHGAIVFLLALFCGCAELSDHVITAEDVAVDTQKKTERSVDDYKKTFWFTGPFAYFEHGFGAGLDKYRLRAGGRLGEPVSWYALYCETGGADWKFPKEAWDRDGNKLPVDRLTEDVASGFAVVHENFAVPLTRGYLDRCATNGGIDIRIDGRVRLHCVLEAPHIQGFLTRVDRETTQPEPEKK